MAKGRMLSNRVGRDVELNSMSLEAELMFLLTIPHLDRDGLIAGDPVPLWGQVAPRRMVLLDLTARIVQEWIDHGLVMRYNSKNGAILFFKNFRKHNQNLIYEREAASEFPAPPGFYRSECGLIPIHPDLAGHLAQDFDARSKYHLALMEASQPASEEPSRKVPETFKDTSGKDHEEIMTSSGSPHDEVEVEVEVKEKGREEEKESNGAEAPTPAFSFQAAKEEPLIKAYHELYDCFPNKAQMKIILEANPLIGDWVRAIRAWAAAGHSPKNVQGMIDWTFEPSRFEDHHAAAAKNDTPRKTGYSEYNHLLPKEGATP